MFIWVGVKAFIEGTERRCCADKAAEQPPKGPKISNFGNSELVYPIWKFPLLYRPEGGEQYVGYLSGILSDRMSGLCRYFVGPYVGIASGLCRYCVGTMSGILSDRMSDQGKPRWRDVPQKGPPRPRLTN